MTRKKSTCVLVGLLALMLPLMLILSCGGKMVNKPSYLTDDEATIVSNYNKVLQTGKTALYEALNVVKGLRVDGKISDYQKSLIVPKLEAFKNSLSKANKALSDYLVAKMAGQTGDMAAVNLVFNTLAASQDLVVQALKDITGTQLKTLEVK